MTKSEFYRDRTVLVSGGAGSIGSEIVRKLLKLDAKVIRILDNNETGLFDLYEKLQSDKVRIFVGDVRDKSRLKMALEEVDIVFHAAALKHVPLCEYNPFEAVKTNVLGTQNLIEAAMEEEVEKVITISTDKAVNPINVVGATKLLAERLTISANQYKGLRRTSFCCVRFGNVLASRGSILPVIKAQIAKGGPVTITDTGMSRFVMSIPQAVQMILEAASVAKGGEIFILKMPALRIIDLVEVMIEELAEKYDHRPEEIELRIIGKRPGEKIHEELVTKSELDNVYVLKDMLVVPPQRIEEKKQQRDSIEKFLNVDKQFLAKEEIRELLKDVMNIE